MDGDIALALLADGVTNGCLYALLALALVVVFSVTRVIFIPQGELVAFAGLTYAALDAGQVPGSLWLLGGLGIAAALAGLAGTRGVALAVLLAQTLLWPALMAAIALALRGVHSGVVAQLLLTVGIIAPMAPYLYAVGFRPLGDASVLVLLIAAVGVHLVLAGLGLLCFGPEGMRAEPFSDAMLTLGSLTIPGQALWVFALTIVLMLALFAFLDLTLAGKALRATAVNRLGARLVGIPAARAGGTAFLLAGIIAGVGGALIVPLTTIGYDSGFLIGLKGFVAAIVGGLVSAPVAAAAAIGVGIVESFAAFWASPFKEVIVFTLIIPVLLWRSLTTVADDEE